MRATRFTTHCKGVLKSMALLAAFSMLPMNGMAQESTNNDKPKFFPKLFGLNKGVSVGIIGGTMNNFDYGVMGFNVTAYGFYADFMGWPGKGYRVEIPTTSSVVWKNGTRWACHIGYQIPFHQYQRGSIRLIPMIGYCKNELGFSYESKDFVFKNNFDYGGALAFQNHDDKIGNYIFYLAYTSHTAWVGLGYEFQLK